MNEKKTACELTVDEWAVIERLREAEYGTVEVKMSKGRIVGVAVRQTFLPPSQETIERN